MLEVNQQNSLILKRDLAFSELEILQASLDNEKVDVLTPICRESAKATLGHILKQHGLSHLSPDTVLLQLQTKLGINPLPKNEPFALHFAARIGDLNQVKKLIKNGYQVNSKDIFGSTPLHMAAMYGHQEVAAYLINQGAKVNANTYLSYDYGKVLTFTPLDLAVKYAPNAEILSVLIHAGGRPDYWPTMINSLVYTLKNLEGQDYTKFDLALKKLEVLVKENPINLSDGFSDSTPVAYILLCNASEATDSQVFQRYVQAVDTISSYDTINFLQNYIITKDFLHAFPSSKNYIFYLDNDEIILPAEGHWQTFTANLAAQTLADYTTNLHSVATPSSGSDKLKQSIFQQVSNIFKFTSEVAPKAGLHETSEKIYQHYMQGETILLPTGWMGHTIDIILNKNNNVILFANAGDSYPDLFPGLNAYHHQLPIGVEDIYTILNNQDQMALEFKQFYDLGLIPAEKYSFETEAQEFGNCTWYSMQVAEQGLLFLELTRSITDTQLAKATAEIWFKELDSFHQTHVLEKYLANPTLEMTALIDVLTHYHKNPMTLDEKHRATLILDALNQTENKAEFIQYYQSHPTEFSKPLAELITHYGDTPISQHTPTPTPSAWDNIKSYIPFFTKGEKNLITLEEVIKKSDDYDPLSVLNHSNEVSSSEISPLTASNSVITSSVSESALTASVAPLLQIHVEALDPIFC